MAAVVAWMVYGVGLRWDYDHRLHHHTWLLLSATILLPLCASGQTLSLGAWPPPWAAVAPVVRPIGGRA